MLIGIVLRGCAFAFRHNDAFRDRSQIHYSRVFTFSSFLTPFAMGLVVGGLVGGKLNPHSKSFFGSFIEPWFHLLSFSLALFVCAQFTFMAAAFLVGETSEPNLKTRLIQRAKRWNIASIASGGLVMLVGWNSGAPLFEVFLSSPASLFTVALATLLIVPIWIALNERATWMPRVLVSAQFSLILLGWTNAQYPYIIPPSPDVGYAGLTLIDQGVTADTLVPLVTALSVGMLLVFPALFYLIRSFKVRSPY
jgi:cytochrome d ubiquinol oxidase subunit II